MARITSVKVVCEERKTRYGIIRTAIGAAVLGLPGAIIAGQTKKDKVKTVFRLNYDNGRVREVAYKNGSFGYKTMMRLVEG